MSEIREAIVIDNSDPDQLGKVKIRIMPEMETFSEDMLPWVGIYKNSIGFSQDVGTHELPENDSLIRVLIEDWPFLRKIRIISDDYVEGLYFYDKSSGLSSITELGTQTYPQPIFKVYKDRTIDFHNSETGEHGTLFSNGGYFLCSANGTLFLNSNNRRLKIYNAQASLKDVLQDVQAVLLGLTTPLNILDGEGRPCTYLNAATDFTKVQQVLIKLNNLLET